MPQSVPLQVIFLRPFTSFFLIVVIALATACSSQRKTSNYTSKKPTKTVRRSAWKYSPPSGQTTRKKPVRKASVRKEPARGAATSLPVGNEQVRATIQEARSFVGTPYRWGGTSRAGMDCSGLLVTAFRRGGIELPRTSVEQSKTGSLVRLHEVVPGDLVFFATQGRRISHVGMVTEVRGKGDVRFIHSSSSLGVVESNLFSDYYQKNFVKARRPF